MASSTIVMLRHGEKPTHDGTPFGVDPHGRKSDDALTPQGWQRAGALVQLFIRHDGSPGVIGLPDRIYAPHYDNGPEHHRSFMTASPLAARAGLAIATPHAVGEEAALAAEIAELPGVTVICWEHKHLPLIAGALPLTGPRPAAEWPGHDRFDVAWVFRRDGAGFAFSVLNQGLLAGDAGAQDTG